MKSYSFKLKSIDIYKKKEFEDMWENSIEGRDGDVYYVIDQNIFINDDGHIEIDGDWNKEIAESSYAVDFKDFEENDISFALALWRQDHGVLWEGQFSINIDGEITSFDDFGEIINTSKEVQEIDSIKEETLSDDFKEGPYQLYHKNGNIKDEGFYKDGELHGVRKMFYENGMILVEMSYENGKIHCLKKLYHDNGKLKEESKWENDDLITGSVKNFDEEGNLI